MTSSSSKPLIGINADYMRSRCPTNSFILLEIGYVDSISAAGGIPIIIPPHLDPDGIKRTLDVLDGVVLVGGLDLDPRDDGFQIHPSMRVMSERRNNFDRSLMSHIADRKMPVFGIGCGMQLMNVTCGGTLCLHIPEDHPKAIPHIDITDPKHRHTIDVVEESLMHRVYVSKTRYECEAEVRVNSRHHMCCDDIAPGFRVTAKCHDGIPEAIESTTDWFAIGTQFHPEATQAASRIDALLFEEFVEGVIARSELRKLAA